MHAGVVHARESVRGGYFMCCTCLDVYVSLCVTVRMCVYVCVSVCVTKAKLFFSTHFVVYHLKAQKHAAVAELATLLLTVPNWTHPAVVSDVHLRQMV